MTFTRGCSWFTAQLSFPMSLPCDNHSLVRLVCTHDLLQLIGQRSTGGTMRLRYDLNCIERYLCLSHLLCNGWKQNQNVKKMYNSFTEQNKEVPVANLILEKIPQNKNKIFLNSQVILDSRSTQKNNLPICRSIFL